MPAAGTCILFVTCPDAKVAEAIARDLVERRLAACGNITGPVTSVYRWKGKVVREPEVLLLVKTRRSLVAACTRAIRAKHPYELPEIVAVPIVGGLPAYLRWVAGETTGKRAR
jgi:periplasmic divalent cation tolerance protein